MDVLSKGMNSKEAISILAQLEKLIEQRVEGIMASNHRKYYAECAAFIAAMGEVKESRGEIEGKQKYMEFYRNKYSRRSAYKNKLQQYGWSKVEV